MNIASGDTILGIGIDIIELERIQNALDRHGARMLNRLFTQNEQDYCLKHKDPTPHLAARFCAKEAIVKALGTGFGEQASWQDIEITNEASGKPIVKLSDWLKSSLASDKILLSMSHSDHYVTAVALWVLPAKKD